MSEPALDRPNVTYLPGATPDDGLLATKLLVPPPRPALVERPRLFAGLDEALRARLAAISAPPGSGKTTLLSAWLGARPTPAAWVSLDEGDNDPIRFWSYAAAALERTVPGSTGPVLAMLRSLQSPETALTALINALAALTDDVLLVLDDYHAITAQPIHDQLTSLLDHLPPRLHLVLTGRAEPPLPLARLRARGQLVELRAADLRFTPDEAAAFLCDVMGLALTAEQIAALDASTEGWAAGLQLAALSMRGRDDVAAFLAAFTGGHHYILDYLGDEVLARLPEDLRRFLLRTCILDRLTAPLCDAVTGECGSAAMLRRLVHGNLFLIPLDDQGGWYRYHHLFAGVLRARLGESDPDVIPDLHRRASRWLESADLLEEAVAHALAAGDEIRAADLAARGSGALWNRGEIGQLRAWLNALPDAVIRARPRLSVYRAWAAFVAGKFTLDDWLVADVKRTLTPETPDDERRAVEGALLMMEAFYARTRADHERCAACARRALALLPASEFSTRGLASICLGHGAYARGDLGLAYDAYREAARTAEEGGDIFAVTAATLGMANVEEDRANLPAAFNMYRTTLDRLSPSGVPSSPAVGYLETGMASVLAEWNRLDEAMRHAERVRDFGKTSQISDFQFNGPMLLAYIHQARGEEADVDAALRAADEIIEAGGVPWLRAVVGVLRTRLALMRGDLAQARLRIVAVEGLMPHHESDDYLLDGPVRSVRTMLARVRIAEGRSDEALALLAPLAARAEQTGHHAALVEAAMLQARALRAKGATDAALNALNRALALAEPGGYVRLFVDEGAPMAALLAELRDRRGDALAPALHAYLETLLGHVQPGALWPATAVASAATSSRALAESLSEREREVLALVVAGASNGEIAARMVVSIHTVKTHLTHIFAKLGVASRTQAIARARDLGMA